MVYDPASLLLGMFPGVTLPREHWVLMRKLFEAWLRLVFKSQPEIKRAHKSTAGEGEHGGVFIRWYTEAKIMGDAVCVNWLLFKIER